MIESREPRHWHFGGSSERFASNAPASALVIQAAEEAQQFFFLQTSQDDEVKEALLDLQHSTS